MGYAQPLYHYSISRAGEESKKAGISGWIVPDVPVEEFPLFKETILKNSLSWIPLVAPTTSPRRAKKIVEITSPPFLYYVSVTGVTGIRESFPEGWDEPLREIRKVVHIPVVVGFGIGSPALAISAGKHAEGVVVGSKIMEILLTEKEPIPPLKEFVRSIRDAL
jgi:tryptophan synthase alpha chain